MSAQSQYIHEHISPNPGKIVSLVGLIHDELGDGIEQARMDKLVYFIDSESYLELGQPITGISYRKEANGPVPVDDLTVGTASVADLPLAEHELALRVLTKYRGLTAEELSNLSHHELGWMCARQGEIIPYETYWLRSTPPTEKERRDFEALLAE